MDPIVSIIIPIYNAEKYLDKLLKKMMEQINEKIEIILINDGSSDMSEEICINYQKVLKRNIKFLSQNNKGVSEARNTGIKLATGKYITFIDSDDMISIKYIDTICNLCNSNADIIEFGYFYGSENDGYKIRKNDIHEGVVAYKDYFSYLIMQKSNEIWNKLFKREIIKENNIFFNSNIMYGEDLLFTLEVMKFSKTIVLNHEPIYYYLKNPNGICSNVKLKYIDNLNCLYINIEKLIKMNNYSSDILLLAQKHMMKNFFRTIGLCRMNKCDKKALKDTISNTMSIQKLKKIKYKEIDMKIRRFLMIMEAYGIIALVVKLKRK